MIVQPKNVFTFTLDPSKGETPTMLLTAMALAIFDLADSFDPDFPEVLTPEQARGHVSEGNRGITMIIVGGKFCLAQVITTRVSATTVELHLAMYDRDPDALVSRTDLYMDQLVHAAAVQAIESLEDVTDFIVMIEPVPQPLRAIA